MAVQKSRKSHSKKRMKRANKALTSPTLSVDPTTGVTHRRHHLTSDGYYKGRQILIVNEVVDEE
jgi:large subunit ribosomal protein L32